MSDPIELDTPFEPVDVAAWRERVRRDLRGKDPDRLTTTLLDGVDVAPLYTEREAPAGAPGRPGAPPFVRGAAPVRDWAAVHVVCGDDPMRARDDARRALAEGADALHVPPAVSRALGDVEALSVLLDGVQAPITIDPGANAVAVAAAFDRLEPRPVGGLVFDPLATLASEGALPMSIEDAMALLAARVTASIERAPDHRPVLIDARPYHEAGASAVDEVGLALAAGVDALRALSDARLALADLPRRMRFAFSLDADLFVGVAKLRAARLGWSKVLRALGIDGPEQGMHVFADTSARAYGSLDPLINALRGTAAAFAAVVGGADRVAVAPYDRPLGSPSPRAERLARNTQLILRWESNLGHVLDPAGGSHYVEALTDRLARSAWTVLQEIDHLGGVARGLRDGSVQARVAKGADARRAAVAERRRVLVGVNRYPSPADPQAGAASDDGARRPGAAASTSDEGAVTVDRLVPLREGEAFERLRRDAAALPDETRQAAVVGVGDAGALKARMDFAREALEVAGLRCTVLDAQPSGDLALEDLDALDPFPRTVALCAPDDAYDALVKELSAPLRERGAQLVVAGKPDDALRDAGVDRFVHLGMDAAAELTAVIVALSPDTPTDADTEVTS